MGKPLYVIYNANEVPFEIYSVSAFCLEHNLNQQAIRDVLRGHSKSYRGWHIDPERTERDNKETDAIMAAFGWTDEQDEEDGGISLEELRKYIK